MIKEIRQIEATKQTEPPSNKEWKEVVIPVSGRKIQIKVASSIDWLEHQFLLTSPSPEIPTAVGHHQGNNVTITNRIKVLSEGKFKHLSEQVRYDVNLTSSEYSWIKTHLYRDKNEVFVSTVDDAELEDTTDFIAYGVRYRLLEMPWDVNDTFSALWMKKKNVKAFVFLTKYIEYSLNTVDPEWKPITEAMLNMPCYEDRTTDESLDPRAFELLFNPLKKQALG